MGVAIPIPLTPADDAAPGVLRHTLGTSADEADGVRSPVPLVRIPGDGRSGVGPLELHDEPGRASGRGNRGEVLAGGGGPTEGEAGAAERPLRGGWDADRGVDLDQELRRKDGQDNDSSG